MIEHSKIYVVKKKIRKHPKNMRVVEVIGGEGNNRTRGPSMMLSHDIINHHCDMTVII